MANDIALSLAQRSTLISLQQIERDSSVAQRRLSFGRRIVDVTDDPAQFFQARGLSLRVENLLQRRSQIDQGVSNLQAQLNGLSGLRDFLNQAVGIADQAQAANTDVDQLRNLTTLFEETIRQFIELAQDTSYNGQNLVTSTAQTLTVNFSNRDESRLDVRGVNVLGDRDATVLGQVNTRGLFDNLLDGSLATDNSPHTTLFSTLAGGTPGADGFEDFLNGVLTTESGNLRTNLVSAVNRIEQIESYFANNVAILQNRLTFTTAYSNTLTIGRDKIVVADVNQEAANLTALRTRSQIGIGALAANASSEQQLLRLLQQ